MYLPLFTLYMITMIYSNAQVSKILDVNFKIFSLKSWIVCLPLNPLRPLQFLDLEEGAARVFF
jgi:hypothetical protein